MTACRSISRLASCSSKRASNTPPSCSPARARGLPSDELRWEELRVEAISRLALHEYDRARALFEAFAKTGSAAHASEAADYLARIRFMRDRRKASPPSAARR
jgi:hypothetical protein